MPHVAHARGWAENSSLGARGLNLCDPDCADEKARARQAQQTDHREWVLAPAEKSTRDTENDPARKTRNPSSTHLLPNFYDEPGPGASPDAGSGGWFGA